MPTKQEYHKAALRFLPLAVVFSVACLLVYATVQQNFRQNANDPQVQLSQDGATALANGVSAQTVVGSSKVDMAKSLAPYVIVFNADGKVVSSSVQLDNETPIPPHGVFAYAKKHGQDRITWQPQKGVRSAIVVTYYSGSQAGFVLAGRSLAEVERREDQLSLLVLLGWAGGLLVGFVSVLVKTRLKDSLKPSRRAVR